MFLDASAVVAILTGEPEASRLLDSLDEASTPPTMSPVTILESTYALSRAKGITLEEADELITGFMDALKVRNVPITSEIGRKALRARMTGERGSRPALTMGESLAQACAKNYGLPLLTKGAISARTEIS